MVIWFRRLRTRQSNQKELLRNGTQRPESGLPWLRTLCSVVDRDEEGSKSNYMAKSANQKAKLLYIIKILEEHTDERHPLSTQEIIDYLAREEIKAERKSIYSDIATLIDFGYDIICSKARDRGGYYLASRDFELAELKLLVDAVQSSRFITARKTKELIGKLEKLTSPYEGKQLQRQVFVSDRIKNGNESIYYSVDEIHQAMQNNLMISFQYYEWGIDKQMHFRKNGTKYEVSPYFLVWKDENYYLVAYDGQADMMKHYRVDKMNALSVIDRQRQGKERAEMENPANYAQQRFGMFAGEEQIVTLQFPERLAGVIFDHFGKNVDIRKREEGLYSVRVKVAVSPQFFGWLTGLGREIKLLSPRSVAEDYKAYISDILGGYEQ